MSNTGLNEDNMELEIEIDIVDEIDKDNGNKYKKYNELRKENHELQQENNLLKDVIIENNKKKFQDSLKEGESLNPGIKYQKIGKSFYAQIILGISVIILTLGFHIVYLAVTSCLLYNNGDFGCWVANWLGIDIHASFYIDIILYSLIIIQVTLLILIIRNKLNERRVLFTSSPR
ncbi:MAG: hypothetical protein ACFE9I_18560 [Candidatus Hermodarchaeota archaeon]